MDIQLGSSSFWGLLWAHAWTAASVSALVCLSAMIGGDHLGVDVFAAPLATCMIAFFSAYASMTWPAARFADRWKRHNVVVAAKVLELLVVLFASAAIYFGNWPALLGAVALSGIARSIYDAARIALVAQWCSSRTLVQANGLLWIAGWIGAILGLIVAQFLKQLTGDYGSELNFLVIPLGLLGLVVSGTMGVSAMAKSPGEQPGGAIRWSDMFWSWLGWRGLLSDAPLLRMALGIVLFWTLAAIGLLTVIPFAHESNVLTGSGERIALAALTIGILVGGVLIGWSSVGRVELGLVPWGALLVVVAWIALATSSGDSLGSLGNGGLSLRSKIGFACLGLGGSFFYIPLVAYFQQHGSSDVRGTLFAATNMLSAIGILLACLFYTQVRSPNDFGNITNLPREYQVASLAAGDQAIVREAEQRFDATAARDPTKSFADKFAELDHALRALLSESIKSSLTQEVVAVDYPRRLIRESDAIAFYHDLFPDLPEAAIRSGIAGGGRSINDNRSVASTAVDDQGLTPQASLVLHNVDTAWDSWERRRDRLASQIRLPPQLNCQLLAAAPIAMRRAGLAQLLWKHLRARQSADETIRERDYAPLFEGDPESQLTVKRVVAQVERQPRMTARQILMLLGILTVPIFVYAMWRVPQAMVRLPLWWAFGCLYRVRVNGLENIPLNGGAVLVINHSTWIDGLIILLMSARRIRMIAWAGNFNNRIMKVLAQFAHVILITGGPKSIQKGLSEGRKALQRGELVGIFPEGGITRTGQVREFRPGLMRILDQMPVPLIPVYIDQIWGSIFSFSGGTSLWKFPNAFRHRLTINIGPALWRPESIYQVRRAVLEEGARAVTKRQPPFVCPAQMFIRASKKRCFKSKIGDSMGQELTGGMLLTRSLILRDLLRKYVLAPDEKIVGILIPPSTGGVIANMAIALDRRVAVHLNYTLSERLINECLKIAGVKHVLTTRKVMEKFNFKLNAEVYYLEDLKDKVTMSIKLLALLRAFVAPARWLEARLGLSRVPPDEMLTVIFTSGSTGAPKGVMLSQRNIASNVEAIGQVICLNSSDTLIGALPFFHSFGYTVTLWGAMGLELRGAYHFSPLEANQVGKLTRTYQGTVLLGTPTFLRTYLRKCTREDFASLNTVVAGAEKLPQELAVAFDHRFGVRPVEGYGTTELSPLVSVNVPQSRTPKNFQSDCKEGTVGRTVPNVVAKITDLDDPKRELGKNASGMLWIKGPNVMLGYMHRPDLTAEVIVDGWYCTGDVAEIDDEGFITLTGRMSRFSKIGGEMIPHIQIEEALTSFLNDENYDSQKVAVTAVPDPKRGERLVVLHTQLEQSPAELCRQLRESGLPNLFVPSEDSFFEVDEIPILGSGKLDLKRMKEVAMQVSGQAPAH